MSTTIPGLNAFVDLSHHNLNVDFKQAQAAGLVGMIHKATQHTDYIDPQYGVRVAQARALGLYIGAYHFATAAPVQQQLDHFLAAIKPFGSAQVLPCLDWELNPDSQQGSMSQQQLVELIDLFKQATGVYPVIYGGYWMLDMLKDEKNLGNLGQCPLWQAFYSSSFGYLSDIWSDWALLQYTDGTLGPEPHSMAGIGPVDRDSFNGSLADVANFWKQHALS